MCASRALGYGIPQAGAVYKIVLSDSSTERRRESGTSAQHRQQMPECHHIYPATRRQIPVLPAKKVISRGLRWLSAMVLVEVPFADRIWGLPVLTVLIPSKSWSERHGRRHRPVTEWTWLVLLTLRRWLP